MKKVKVVVYVNGVECATAENDIPDEHVNRVLGAVCNQVDDPDLEDSDE